MRKFSKTDMNSLSNIVISKKTYSKNSLKFISFFISLFIHVTLLATALHVELHKKETFKEHKRVTISLSQYKIVQEDKKSVKVPTKELTETKTVKKPVKKIVKKSVKKTPKKITPIKKPQVSSFEAFKPQKTLTAEKEDVLLPPSSTIKPQHTQEQNSDLSVVAIIRELIASTLSYPLIAKKLKLEGIVTVAFSLSKNGFIENLQIISGSGSSSLDKRALQTLLMLDGKYPHVSERMDLEVPISFSLKKS